jgi:hypothetical protein
LHFWIKTAASFHPFRKYALAVLTVATSIICAFLDFIADCPGQLASNNLRQHHQWSFWASVFFPFLMIDKKWRTVELYHTAAQLVVMGRGEGAGCRLCGMAVGKFYTVVRIVTTMGVGDFVITYCAVMGNRGLALPCQSWRGTC